MNSELSGLQATRSLEPHLENYGGKTLKHPKFVNIYLGGYWDTRPGQAVRNYNDSFTKKLVRGPYAGWWTEYGGGKGTFLGSSVQKLKTPVRVVNETLLQRIVTEAKKEWPKANEETIFSVFLPPSMVLKSDDGMSSLDGMGGYHGCMRDDAGTPTYYAGIVYGRGTNGINFTGKSKENITIVASHEWTETITDPQVNCGTLGWYDERYGEVSDIPLNLGLPLQELIGRVDGYLVQKNWSNDECAVKLLP